MKQQENTGEQPEPLLLAFLNEFRKDIKRALKFNE